MFHSFRNNNRAVSEVIASLVILLVVSAAGTVLYSYSMEMFNSYWSSFGLQTQEREEQTLEKIAVIFIWWDRTDGLLNLTILNYGKIELRVDAVYINGMQASINEGKGVIIFSGEKINIIITSPVPILYGETYQIVAASTRGTKDELIWKAYG